MCGPKLPDSRLQPVEASASVMYGSVTRTRYALAFLVCLSKATVQVLVFSPSIICHSPGYVASASAMHGSVTHVYDAAYRYDSDTRGRLHVCHRAQQHL